MAYQERSRVSYGHGGQCPVNVGHALHLPLSLIDVCRDCGKERSHVPAGLLDFALHLDKHLSAIIVKHGKATYGILWAIVFAFWLKEGEAQPSRARGAKLADNFINIRRAGDSLLFAAGAFAALGSLNLGAVCAVFISAAIIGDAVNYAIGNYLGGSSLAAFASSPCAMKCDSFGQQAQGMCPPMFRGAFFSYVSGGSILSCQCF